MSRKLNLADKLDFSEIDLTAPNKVVEEILSEIPEQTHGIISGSITEYKGHVVSYMVSKPSLATALTSITADEHVDIQDSLGMQCEEIKKYECFLYTAGYNKYKYRMFFMKYGIANYPVQFTLEESIAKSIQSSNSGYIFICNNREQVEDLVIKIITSNKVVGVMQELIRVYQAKKMDECAEVVDNTVDGK